MMLETEFFKGTATALVTPFLDGRINYPMMEQLLRRQIDAGIRTVVIAGTTGESAALDDGEKIELIRCSKSYAGDSLRIVAGTGSSSTDHAVALSLEAQKAGADGLLVVSPSYNKGNPAGLYDHYLAITSQVSVPVILYNVPGRTGYDLPVSLCGRLAALPHMIGIKEASGDLTKISRLLHSAGRNFAIWSGNDILAVPTISIGGKGVISVLSNLLPAEMKLMTDAALDGDFDTAADLHRRLLPAMEAMNFDVNPVPIKAAMKTAGFDCGPCRLPLGPMEPDSLQKLETVIRHLLDR